MRPHRTTIWGCLGWCSVFKRVVFFCGAHDSCPWLRKAPQGVCSCSESGSGRCLRRRLNGHMKGQSTRNVQKVDAQSAAKLTQTSHEFPSCTLPSCLKKKPKWFQNQFICFHIPFAHVLQLQHPSQAQTGWLWLIRLITQPSSSCSCSTSGKRQRFDDFDVMKAALTWPLGSLGICPRPVASAKVEPPKSLQRWCTKVATTYPLVLTDIAIENGPCIVDLPIKAGDFP